MPTVEVLLQLKFKLSAFTCSCWTDEAVSKQCDSEALIHPFDDVRKKNWPKPGKFFTVCFGPPSQSIGRGRLSRKGALDVRESREGRDKTVTIFSPGKQEKRKFGMKLLTFLCRITCRARESTSA